MALHDDLLPEIVRRIREVVPDVCQILLFGSRARGDARDDSDFDLVVITPTVPASGPRSVEIRLALRGLGVGFDLVRLTPEEWADLRTRRGSTA